MLQLLDYTIQETIYEGAETLVRRAIHQPSQDRVVIKLPVADSPNLRTIGRLIHEHQILTRLTHVAGIARPFTLLQQAGNAALVLKSVELPSLSQVLAKCGRLPVETVLRLALSLCNVLQGVHSAGIMHKDVKPQNVLVNEAGTEVILIDFGIASELSQEMSEAGLPEVLEGTLAYISPEQTGRTARGLDARTDLYSLGILLFEALSGRRPFIDKDPLALVYAHLAKAPPSIEALVPDIPSTLARILERCLEKQPENRYQTAKGLAVDLERALGEWTQSGQIQPFALGQKDFSPVLRLPQTLVSREKESQEITVAFERASSGGVEMLVLGGPSGGGKTALVRSVYRDIAKAGRGLLLSGKHDQLGRSVPYAALAQAFSGLLNNLAASPKSIFEQWRARIANALGPNARVIADLVPELEWLLGPLAPVPVVPTEMAYNRLKFSWIKFVHAVTEASPPLVLFLDDMQWVDPASLELLKVLLLDVGRKNLLVIAAYRNNEVDTNHPMWTLVEAVSTSGVPTPQLTVGPLSEASARDWLAITLSATPERVDPLAKALYRKTNGNPFFLGQLLLELYRQKRIRRNLEDGVWQWDQQAVEQAAITDNVVELMRSKVAELPTVTQELLGQAACAGNTFSFDELIVLSGRSANEVATALWPAVVSGLVSPSEGPYRETQALAQMQTSSQLSASYRFLHDRVQQAFYEGIAPDQRVKTHLLIGRRLERAMQQQGGEKASSGQKQLEMLRHLNLGAAAIENPSERKELARMNLAGAKTAKVNGSYRLQAMLVEQSQQLLGPHAWEDEPLLSVELMMERVEADYMLKEFAEVHRRAEEILALPLPALPRLAAQELRMRTCLASGQYQEGERLGLMALEEQGIFYPASNDACIAEALQRFSPCDAWLDQHPEGFDAAAADPSPEHLLIDAMEVSLLLCAGLGQRPALTALVIMRKVQQATERQTLTAIAPFFLAALAHVRSAFLGDYRGAVRWTREGERAARRLASPLLPEIVTYRGIYLPYEAPIEQSRAPYQAAIQAAIASGSFQGTSWGLAGELYFLDSWAGRPLEQVADRERAQRDLIMRLGDAVGQHHFELAASYIAFLRSPSRMRLSAEQEWLDKDSRYFLALGDGISSELARIQEAHLFLAFGEYRRALERAEEADRSRPNIYGNPPVTDIPLWLGLASAKLCLPELSQEQRAPLLATLESAITRFQYFTEGCPDNFGHKLRLLQAEHARLHGRPEQAFLAYGDAIEQAHATGFLHIEALAAQFCVDFLLSTGRKLLAAQYLRQACDAYARWGALALVAHLESQHPSLCLGLAGSQPSPRTSITESSSMTGHGVLDVDTTIRAAQAVSSELDPNRIVARLMQLVQENAGAQRAALLLVDQDQLSVIALLSGSQIHAGLAEPLSPSHPIAQTVVRFVLRTREAIVLSDAPSDARFADDPHLRGATVRSLLAVPLIHQGRLGGLLYLEHATARAFSPARVSLLSVLASQSAIALENAKLYVDLQAANVGLEAKVAERTAALNNALKELWAEMDLAQKIQSVLLPPAQVFFDRYEFAGLMKPADQVGGDYFDAFEAQGKLWLLIGDVSGHGISAGLIMMMVQTAVRSLVHSFADAGLELTPARLLALVNRAVWSNLQLIGKGQYMTMTALCLSRRQLVYAGLHQRLLVFRGETKQVEERESDGVWLGVLNEIEGLNENYYLDFNPGDVLFLYTDGLTEAHMTATSREMIDIAPVRACFQQACSQEESSGALTRSILSLTSEAAVNDDISVVAVRYLSPSGT